MPIKHVVFNAEMPIEHLRVVEVRGEGALRHLVVEDDFGVRATFVLRPSSDLSAELNVVQRKLWDCTHLVSTEVRTKLAVNGRPMVALQCLDCGRKAGEYLKKIDWPEHRPPWDDGIYERRRDELVRECYPILLKHLEMQQDGDEAYGEYLLSPDWRQKRKLVLDRDDHLCQGCRKARATEVHHLTYSHIYDEFLFQLTSLCSECHERFHAQHSTDEASDGENN